MAPVRRRPLVQLSESFAADWIWGGIRLRIGAASSMDSYYHLCRIAPPPPTAHLSFPTPNTPLSAPPVTFGRVSHLIPFQ
jgi:hypothetical protein